jgi:hypothetical protein
VLNAPVELRCRRSNSSCSFGGSRGGAGPVANAVRTLEVEKRRREERSRCDLSSRDIPMSIEPVQLYQNSKRSRLCDEVAVDGRLRRVLLRLPNVLPGGVRWDISSGDKLYYKHHFQ